MGNVIDLLERYQTRISSWPSGSSPRPIHRLIGDGQVRDPTPIGAVILHVDQDITGLRRLMGEQRSVGEPAEGSLSS